MQLKNEVAEVLNGFEKRMKFINIVRTITEYKYADNIRAILVRRGTGLLILFLQLWSLSRKEHLVRILIARFQM